jgi:hypothetical protein
VRAVGPQNWYEMKGPISGCRYSSSFAGQDRLRHELYIDTGDGEKNMRIFDLLRDRQEQLESEYGGSLSWEELPGKRASRVADYKDECSVLDPGRHDEYIEGSWMLVSGCAAR